jgi:hypothetical protein
MVNWLPLNQVPAFSAGVEYGENTYSMSLIPVNILQDDGQPKNAASNARYNSFFIDL